VRSVGKGGTAGTDGIEGITTAGADGTKGTTGSDAVGSTADGSTAEGTTAEGRTCCADATDAAVATTTPVGALDAWGVTGAIVSLATKIPFVSTVATTSTATVTTRVFWAARRWKKR
jgi:hypothetical protein